MDLEAQNRVSADEKMVEDVQSWMEQSWRRIVVEKRSGDSHDHSSITSSTVTPYAGEEVDVDRDFSGSITNPTACPPLPNKQGSRLYRTLRWNFFSTYRRMFTIIFAANVAVLVGLAGSDNLSFNASASAASVNLLVAILMRQEHVVNLLFIVSSSLPQSAPLFLRRLAAKIYTYGGMHSGCGCAAAAWFVAFTGLVTKSFQSQESLLPVVVISYVILALLILILVFAYPYMRMRLHDYFEMTHRFAGWTIVALFWVLTRLLAHTQAEAGPNHSTVHALIHTTAFWCILIITVCLIYPWTRLRLRKVYVEQLSPHAARLHFDHTRLDRALGVRLSTNPLVETHAFATIPNADGTKGFSVVISNAGDWTKDMINNPNPRKDIWIKGAPTYGVIKVSKMFKKVLVVTTGSGIGPCLSMLNGNNEGKFHVLWSTPEPEKTYRDPIIKAVYDCDPNATVIDTRKAGRPDMVALTWRLYHQTGSEAVIVISNPRVTKKIVYGMESRGIPAYGPVFDS